jgi:hypothetical protein
MMNYEVCVSNQIWIMLGNRTSFTVYGYFPVCAILNIVNKAKLNDLIVNLILALWLKGPERGRRVDARTT